jgi:hypothetical protein
MAPLAQHDVLHEPFDRELTVTWHVDVRKISGMRSSGIQEAMLAPTRSEMPSSGFESGRVALTGVMNVERMDTCRKAPKDDPQQYSVRRLTKERTADCRPTRVLERGTSCQTVVSRREIRAPRSWR